MTSELKHDSRDVKRFHLIDARRGSPKKPITVPPLEFRTSSSIFGILEIKTWNWFLAFRFY